MTSGIAQGRLKEVRLRTCMFIMIIWIGVTPRIWMEGITESVITLEDFILYRSSTILSYSCFV